MTLAEFNAYISDLLSGYDTLIQELSDYIVFFNELKSQDPCVKGFDEKLAELDKRADKVNALKKEQLAKVNLLDTNFQSLSFFDRLSVNVNDITKTTGAKSKIVTDLNTKAAGRADLRKTFEACPLLKDPAVEPNKTDPAETTAQQAATDVTGSNQVEQQNRQYVAAQGVDDDKNNKAAPTNAPGSGTTDLGKQDTPNAQKTDTISEARLKNPLGNFASYTYQLTLYMVSPGAYNAFLESDRTNINAVGAAQTNSRNVGENTGVYIVAQSGGVNRAESRAPYLDVDYYIDDLKIKTAISPSASRSATNTVDIEFKIIEPYGFSLITQLKLASETLKRVKSAAAPPGYGELKNAIKQFFVLGIRFVGYDADGNLIPPNSTSYTLDKPNNNELYEQYYDIVIEKLNFKLDGRSTVYNIKAKAISTFVGMGIKYGRIDDNAQIEADNVEEALKKLMERLTTISKNGTQNTFNVTFVGPDINLLKQAQFYNPSDLSKLTSAMSIAKTITQVNEVTALESSVKFTTKQFKLKNDTSILQAIDDIIAQSSYMTRALSIIYKANLQDVQDIEEKSEQKKQDNNEIMWYHVSADVRVGAYDPDRGDYKYDITYVIEPYKTPVVRAAYIPKTTKYYGPHKRYEYYFTGQNSEILSYEQTFNNAYFTVQDKMDRDTKNSQSNATQNGEGTSVPNKRQDESRPADPNKALSSQNAYRVSLFDPASLASAKVTILGDPDFLVQPNTTSVQKVYQQFYGTNRTINANGGQVFVEISFNEAKDYGDDGLLEINDNLLLWDYPKDIAKEVKGIIYQVNFVVSSFSKGRFTQELDLKIHTLPNTDSQPEKANSATTAATTVQSPNINPSTPPDTNTTTTSQRTVPNKVPQDQSTAETSRLGRSTPQRQPDPVVDEEAMYRAMRFGTF